MLVEEVGPEEIAGVVSKWTGACCKFKLKDGADGIFRVSALRHGRLVALHACQTSGCVDTGS
jgi:hypothetical protein